MMKETAGSEGCLFVIKGLWRQIMCQLGRFNGKQAEVINPPKNRSHRSDEHVVTAGVLTGAH